MKPKVRSLKQAGIDYRFTSEIASLLLDPLRQRLADRIRSGEFVCTMSAKGGLLLQVVRDGEFISEFCNRCGCTYHDPCEGGCAWAIKPRVDAQRNGVPGLCTACLTNDEICQRIGMKPVRLVRPDLNRRAQRAQRKQG